MGMLVNIDNGGTFTDVCTWDGSRMAHAKAPTTPHDLTQCFVAVLTRVSRELYGEEDLARLVRETDYLRYSTTSGTNAVVERKGQAVALVVERGEEERVYGATELFSANNLWAAMVPMKPAGIGVGPEGQIDATELLEVVASTLQSGAQRLVFALRQESAERAVKQILLDRYPRHLLGAVPFLISYELVKDADHMRRTLTAVLNSYLHTGMEHFLYGAENVCKQNHLPHPLLIYRNDGDSARVAKTTAIRTWGSGPRGGLEGAAAYARLYDIDTLVAMDIGGTTTDLSVVRNGKIKLIAHGAVEVATTSLPLPDMHSFGLGGSSVVAVHNGEIKIGPESVGASPGPACFGRGGKQATLTDALLLAGVIDGERYLGGELKLDRQRAEKAVEANVAVPLKLTVDAAVVAIIAAFEELVAAEMKHAIIASGSKPSQATMLAFGGGGAMIATGIAEAAGIGRVIVPHMAAVFSAFGIGFSNLAHEYRTPLANGAIGRIESLKSEMLERARRDMYGEGISSAACKFDFSLLTTQDGEIIAHPLSADKLKALASAADLSLGLKAVFPLPMLHLNQGAAPPGGVITPTGKTAVRTGPGKAEEIPLYWATDFSAGQTARGPALIRDDYLTCLLKPGWSLRVSANMDLILEEASK